MTIRFKCEHCHKPLSVKDHLAGKKAACPVCKKTIAIPAAVTAPVDVDALVAEALADQAAEKAAEPVKFIDFICPFCDEELKLPADLGGKKTPCPKCTNIIKVPLPQVAKPKDWRTNQSIGPSAARANLPEQPDDAWSTAQKTRVSQRAMEEAGALPDERPPIGVGGWLRRGAWACVLIAVIAVVFTIAGRARQSSREQNHLEEAKKYIDKLPPLQQGEFYRAAGEIAVRNRRLSDAQTNFTVAQSLLANAPPSDDRDRLLIHVLLGQAEMGGTEEERSAAANATPGKTAKCKTRCGARWKPLAHLKPRPRRFALAGLMRDKNQPEVAIGLAGYLANGPGPTILAEQVGLQLARGEGGAAIPEAAAGERFAPPDAGQPITDVGVRVAYTEGNAFKGNYGEALRFATNQGPAADRLEACVAGASIALMDPKSKNAGQEALPFIKEGLLAYRDYQKENAGKFPGWLGLELIRLASLADAAPDIKDLVDKLPPALAPRSPGPAGGQARQIEDRPTHCHRGRHRRRQRRRLCLGMGRTGTPQRPPGRSRQLRCRTRRGG